MSKAFGLVHATFPYFAEKENNDGSPIYNNGFISSEHGFEELDLSTLCLANTLQEAETFMRDWKKNYPRQSSRFCEYMDGVSYCYLIFEFDLSGGPFQGTNAIHIYDDSGKFFSCIENYSTKKKTVKTSFAPQIGEIVEVLSLDWNGFSNHGKVEISFGIVVEPDKSTDFIFGEVTAFGRMLHENEGNCLPVIMFNSEHSRYPDITARLKQHDISKSLVFPLHTISGHLKKELIDATESWNEGLFYKEFGLTDAQKERESYENPAFDFVKRWKKVVDDIISGNDSDKIEKFLKEDDFGSDCLQLGFLVDDKRDFDWDHWERQYEARGLPVENVINLVKDYHVLGNEIYRRWYVHHNAPWRNGVYDAKWLNFVIDGSYKSNGFDFKWFQLALKRLEVIGWQVNDD